MRLVTQNDVVPTPTEAAANLDDTRRRDGLIPALRKLLAFENVAEEHACPFCGTPHDGRPVMAEGYYQMVCKTCGVGTARVYFGWHRKGMSAHDHRKKTIEDAREAAINLWNMRTPM